MSDEQKQAEMVIEKLKESDNRQDLRVYDCPVELKNELISMSKLYYDNEMWKVIADALELLKKEKEGDFDNRYAEIEGRISKLEEEIHTMKMMDAYSRNEKQKRKQESKNDIKPGLGEAPKTDVDSEESIEALKDINGEN